MRAIHFHVSGRVQGVWFRASTRREATRLGLHGWVRNLLDGRVEGWAEGEEGAVAQLASWLEDGPELARVDDLEIEEVEPTGHQDFRVR
jgi:acylphosphatase